MRVRTIRDPHFLLTDRKAKATMLQAQAIRSESRRFGLKILVTISAFSLLGIAAAHAAPQYPPAIVTPVIGEKLIAPTTPLKKGVPVFVPQVRSLSIPSIQTSETKISTQTPKQNLGATSFPNALVVTKNIYVGGLTAKQINRTPLVSFKANRESEIQVASMIPTSIEASGLPKNLNARVYFVRSNGGSTFVGFARTSSTGLLRLPPLTFEQSNLSIKVKIDMRSLTVTHTVRSSM